MKIINPEAHLWLQPGDTENGVFSHVAQCARVCRQVTNSKTSDKVLCGALIKQQHLSMFRHCTYYFCVPASKGHDNRIISNIINRAFVLHTTVSGGKHGCTRHYICINGNAWLDLPLKHQQFLKPYEITETQFLMGGKANTHPNQKKALPLLRSTVSIVTQISTSRELNRVSPNNITEQSTRYVNFGRKGGITICQPHWYGQPPTPTLPPRKGEGVEDTSAAEKGNKGSLPWGGLGWVFKHRLLSFIHRTMWQLDEWAYNLCLRLGQKPEDARGLLPLDTATQCVYTYTNKEWDHLFDLRITGTTGKPHPNAVIAASHIKEEVEKHNGMYPKE